MDIETEMAEDLAAVLDMTLDYAPDTIRVIDNSGACLFHSIQKNAVCEFLRGMYSAKYLLKNVTARYLLRNATAEIDFDAYIYGLRAYCLGFMNERRTE